MLLNMKLNIWWIICFPFAIQKSLQIYLKNSVEESFPVSLIPFIAMQNIILKNMKMIMKVLLSIKNSWEIISLSNEYYLLNKLRIIFFSVSKFPFPKQHQRNLIKIFLIQFHRLNRNLNAIFLRISINACRNQRKRNCLKPFFFCKIQRIFVAGSKKASASNLIPSFSIRCKTSFFYKNPASANIVPFTTSASFSAILQSAIFA